MGCSSDTTDVNKSDNINDKLNIIDTVDISKQSYTLESIKKNPVTVDYSEKTNLIFNSYRYEDIFTGLGIEVHKYNEDEASIFSGFMDLSIEFGSDDYKYEKLGYFTIRIPVVSKEDLAFKEQLSLMIKSIGYTNKDAENIYSQIEEYFNNEKVVEENKEKSHIEVNLLRDEYSKVTMYLDDIYTDDGMIEVFIKTSNDNLESYLKSSKIKFQRVDYRNSNTNLNLSQLSSDFSLDIPLKNINDKEFREQLELMIKSVGGSDEDFKKTLAIIEGKLKLNEEKEIKITDNYIVYVNLVKGNYISEDEVCVEVYIRKLDS